MIKRCCSVGKARLHIFTAQIWKVTDDFLNAGSTGHHFQNIRDTQACARHNWTTTADSGVG